MKINVMKFSALVSLMSRITSYTFDHHECQDLLNRINELEEINTEPYQPPKADIELVDQLMMLMIEGTQKISAIKALKRFQLSRHIVN